MSDQLADTLKKLPKRSRWFFPTVTGKKHAHVYKIVERVAKHAKIKGAHPHKFRSTFLTASCNPAAILRTSRRSRATSRSKPRSGIWVYQRNSAVRP